MVDFEIIPMQSHTIKKLRYFPPKRRDVWNGKLYVPISINNGRVRDIESLKEIFTFLFAKCDKFTAIIGDQLHRHNLIIFDQLSELEAHQQANQLGKAMRAHLENAVAEIEQTNKL